MGGSDGEHELILIYIYPSIKSVKNFILEMNIANSYSHQHFSGTMRKRSS